MRIMWTDKKQRLQKKGIHLYDESLLQKIMRPYAKREFNTERIIYIHGIETDKKYEVILEELEKTEMEQTLEKFFAFEYEEEEPKPRWVNAKELEKKAIPEYELNEKDWKVPKKKGGVDTVSYTHLTLPTILLV